MANPTIGLFRFALVALNQLSVFDRSIIRFFDDFMQNVSKKNRIKAEKLKKIIGSIEKKNNRMNHIEIY